MKHIWKVCSAIMISLHSKKTTKGSIHALTSEENNKFFSYIIYSTGSDRTYLLSKISPFNDEVLSIY